MSERKAPRLPGLYWVRFEYRAPSEPTWTVSHWDGERWTNIGHEDSFTPEESTIVEWSGPIAPPEHVACAGCGDVRTASCGSDDCPVPLQLSDDRADEEAALLLQKALRYVWDAWSDAEGSGQPEAAVFGPDRELRKYLEETEVPWREAPGDVQNAIRNVIGIKGLGGA